MSWSFISSIVSMLLPRITCATTCWCVTMEDERRHAGSMCSSRTALRVLQHWPCQRHAGTSAREAASVRTTIPRSTSNLSSWALSRTTFMNWSNPRMVPDTCLLALSFTAHGQVELFVAHGHRHRGACQLGCGNVLRGAVHLPAAALACTLCLPTRSACLPGDAQHCHEQSDLTPAAQGTYCPQEIGAHASDASP